jgi:TPR repeat protein
MAAHKAYFDEKKYDKAEALWLEVAKGTDQYSYKATQMLSTLLYNESGKMPNPEKFLEWMVKDVEHPEHKLDGGLSEYIVGSAYKEGRGAPKDVEKACAWYVKAYKGGEHLNAPNRMAEVCTAQMITDPGAKQAMEKVRAQWESAQQNKAIRQLQDSRD